MVFLLGSMLNASAQEEVFYDYDVWKDKIVKNICEYVKENGETKISVDEFKSVAVNHNLDKGKSPFGVNLKNRKATCTGVELKEMCKQSSFIVCGFSGDVRQKNGWEVWPMASATVLSSDGICATNYHVLFDFFLTGLIGDNLGNNNQRFIADAAGHVYPINEILAVDPVNDFALFRVELKGDKIQPLPISNKVLEGEKVYCLSHPRDMPYIFTDGVVSRNVSRLNRKNGYRKYETEITADFGVGASGGPVIDSKGNLIGIVGSTFTMFDNQNTRKNLQMVVKKAVPAFLIKNALSRSTSGCQSVGGPESKSTRKSYVFAENLSNSLSMNSFENQANSSDEVLGIVYRMTYLYDKENNLKYVEDRVVWANKHYSKDVPYLFDRNYSNESPDIFYYDRDNKILAHTYRLLTLELFAGASKNDVTWEIVPDAYRAINGYICYKAVCERGGRKWSAWFTRDIPVVAAPYTLHGLDGVIVEVSDESNEIKWEMLKSPISVSQNETFPQNQVSYQESNQMSSQLSHQKSDILHFPKGLTSVSKNELMLIRKYFGLTPIPYVSETFFGRGNKVPDGVSFPSRGVDALHITNPIELQ